MEPVEDQISDLEGLWLYVALVAVAEGMLIVSCSQCVSTPNFLQVEYVLLALLVLIFFLVSQNLGAS